MISVYNRNSRYLYIPFAFLLLFSAIASIYIQRDADLDQKHFATHAAILADDIWALNESGATAYLQLAVKANYYKSLSVSLPGADTFISVESQPLTGLSGFLYQMRLVGLKKLSQEIKHDNQIIGTLKGEKYIRGRSHSR